jgi:hypothetical protein
VESGVPLAPGNLVGDKKQDDRQQVEQKLHGSGL